VTAYSVTAGPGLNLPTLNLPGPIPPELILCADDYGLSPGVGAGIRALLDAGRLNATSCMTNSPDWPAEAVLLRPFAERASIGLHFTLTGWLAPLSPSLPRLAPATGPATGDRRFGGVGRLLLLSHLGRVPEAEVTAELTRQLDAFESAIGRPPSHVDGHQHVHVLPGIRGPLLRLLARRIPDPDQRPWLRDCAEPAARILRLGISPAKALLIAGLSQGFATDAAAAGFRTNSGFRGIYDLTDDGRFADRLRCFLDGAHPGSLIMVHPALPDTVLADRDPVTAARYAEQAVLAGDSDLTNRS
jgi:chitin disaccharide deacetylase